MTSVSNFEVRTIPRSEHSISTDDICQNAKKVLKTLQTAGHESYLVGGSVRDLLLGQKPKDFDIATSAHPEEVKALFKNCRLIGRRFKLAHILFGREIIEVATFRSTPNKTSSTRKDKLTHSQKGQILCDNQYGTLEEDAYRRDFTINAMYFDLQNESILDFAHGLDDLSRKQLQLIGQPEERYQEDPVRMLRAIRFACKLNFSIAPESAKPIKQQAHLLKNIPGARLFDECQKLFSSGHAEQTFQLLKDFGLLNYLFPLMMNHLDKDHEFQALINSFLQNTDDRIRQGKSTTLAFLIAVFYWQPFKESLHKLQDDGLPLFPSIHQAAHMVLNNQNNAITIPRRFAYAARDIWELQFRLPQRQGKKTFYLVEHPRFRAAYDFLLLREDSGEIKPGLGQWWTDYQDADEEQRQRTVQKLRSNSSRKNKKTGKYKHTKTKPGKKT